MKKFFRTVTALTLVCGAFAFTGCTDYEEDINSINNRLDELTTGQIASIEEQVGSLSDAIDEADGLISALQGDVDALVTLTTGATPTITTSASFGAGITAAAQVPTEAEVKEVFGIKLYTNTTDNAGGAEAYTTPKKVLAETGVLYVYAEVTWTSDVGDLTGVNADKRDTWIGENVTSVSYTLSYTAEQDSVRPPQGQGN